MPNHITNRLKVIGDEIEVKKLFEYVKGESAMDFNKIKPMPESLDIEIHSGIEGWVKLCTGQIDVSVLFESMPKTPKQHLEDKDFSYLSKRMEARNAIDILMGLRGNFVSDFSDDELSMFIQALNNYREHKAISWYDWRSENWGTKWNAYGQDHDKNKDDTIWFQTAWASPVNLINELSSKFPLLELQLDYADEDSGCNTGNIRMKAGELIEINNPENESNEAYELYLELNPDCDYIKLVDGKYQYVEEEA